jgi:hypothetical protein
MRQWLTTRNIIEVVFDLGGLTLSLFTALYSLIQFNMNVKLEMNTTLDCSVKTTNRFLLVQGIFAMYCCVLTISYYCYLIIGESSENVIVTQN